MATEEYRGFELEEVNVTSIGVVNVSSNNPHLMSKLGQPNVIIQGPDKGQAMTKAKRYIDELLDGKETSGAIALTALPLTTGSPTLGSPTLGIVDPPPVRPPAQPPTSGWMNTGDDAAIQGAQQDEVGRRFRAATSMDTTGPVGPLTTRATIPTGVEPADIPSVDSIPQQVTTASQFVPDSEGRLDLVPDPLDQALLADPIQRGHYDEMRYKVVQLSGLGHNQLADLSGPIDRFLAAVPERMEDTSIARLWSRGNTLRRRLKAHETAAALADPDPARLPVLVGEMLYDLVESYNVFIAGEPKGREFDHVRLGPQERDAALATVDAALPIVEAVRQSGLATAAAVEALTEQVKAARDASSRAGVDGDQAVDLARKTAGNFFTEILRAAYHKVLAEPGFAWKEIRSGGYRLTVPALIAGGYIPPIISFIVDNVDKLKVFIQQAFNNPELVRIIEMIVQAADPAL